MIESNFLVQTRNHIVEQYKEHSTNCGSSFGELLCYELHVSNITFIQLAKKWGISLPTLGELIKDHCDKLQRLPRVKFEK